MTKLSNWVRAYTAVGAPHDLTDDPDSAGTQSPADWIRLAAAGSIVIVDNHGRTSTLTGDDDLNPWQMPTGIQIMSVTSATQNFTAGTGQAPAPATALPSGAATSAKQDTGNTSLGTIAGAVKAEGVAATAFAVVAGVDGGGLATGLLVDGFGQPQVVVQGGTLGSITSLPLPSGAASEITLAAQKLSLETKANTGNASLSAIDTDLDTVKADLDLIAGTDTATAALQASATLPVAGAYEADPLDAAMVAIPAGKEWANVFITYTQGTTNGQAAHKMFFSDGAGTPVVSQILGPDGTFAGVPGRVGTSKYALSVRVRGGAKKIGISSAEVGIIGTPGTAVSAITFE